MLKMKGMRFPQEIILVCIRWFAAYALSYRNLEEMVAELGSDSNSGRGSSSAQATNTKLDSDPNSAGPAPKAVANKKRNPKTGSDPNSAVSAAEMPAPPWLTVQTATMHNLQSVTAQVPLQRLVAITGDGFEGFFDGLLGMKSNGCNTGLR